MRVVFVFFYKEIGFIKEIGIVKYICVCCKFFKKMEVFIFCGFFFF